MPSFASKPMALFSFGAVMLSGGCAASDGWAPAHDAAGDSMVVLRDGRALHLTCIGAGEPTVVLDAGLGMDSSVWGRVEAELARTTRVCAYDRAGYGLSDPGPLPRDAKALAADLMGMLDASGEPGPFVLVAHSAADLTTRVATKRRPDMIAGLVLVDPGIELDALRAIGPAWAASFDEGQAAALRCIRATAAGEMRPGTPIYVECGSPPTEGPLASRAMAQAVLSESESEPPGADQIVSAPGALGDLPLIVLTAEDKFGTEDGAGPAETGPLRQAWFNGGAAIAALSSRGDQRTVPNTSHVIQIQSPDAVIVAVRNVVAQVRAGADAADLETP